MNIIGIISSRRSIRAFTPDPVSDEDIRTIIQAASSAPSGGNAQAWVFISVLEPRRIQALRAISPGMVSQPAAVIILCIDQRLTSGPPSEPDYLTCYDLGAAMQNILLTAHFLGLGGCAIASFHEESLSKLVNLPDEVKPHLLVAIGKPRTIPATPHKRELNEIYYKEKYGDPYGC